MALSPSYLDSCPAGVVSLWQQCEDDILRDMARKIRKYNFYIPSSQWQENRLKAGRQTRKDIVKTLSKYTGMSQAAVNKLIQESAQLSVSEDVNAITRGDAYKVGELDRAALNQILRSSALQTNNAISNICATTANTATQQFERALDRAWMQVSSGAFSLDTAVERACLDLANSGISAIQYAKKADTIEVAVRRAVRTGVNQTALKLTGEICDQLECDLVEVSAHAGARPEHEAWHGQIYSRSGKSKKYPPFTRTGYGTGAGLGGWNCRHSFAPYVEGSPRAYDDAKLQSFKEKTRTYNGHELTEYEATQYQRALERDLRRYKRQQLAGVNGAQEKLDAANARLDDYCKQTGLKRQYSRDDVVGWNGEYNHTDKFKPVKISEKVTSGATKSAQSSGTMKYIPDYDCEIARKFGADHYDAMHKMIVESPHETAAAVWKKYEPAIEVGDARFTGHAHASGGRIYLNGAKDALGNSYEAPYQVSFHESGHAIDSIARYEIDGSWGARHYSAAYKGGLFPDTITEEVQDWVKTAGERIKAEFKANAGDVEWFRQNGYISSWAYSMFERGIYTADDVIPKYSKSIAYSEVQKIVKGSGSMIAYGDLSDILEGATGAKIQCGIGHGAKYWKERTYGGVKDGLATEAFAEMMDSTFANRESLELIQKYLPRSYAVFVEMLESLL